MPGEADCDDSEFLYGDTGWPRLLEMVVRRPAPVRRPVVRREAQLKLPFRVPWLRTQRWPRPSR